MFFIVLDLRLTKVGVQRNSFFYAFFQAISLVFILISSCLQGCYEPSGNSV